MKKKTPTKKSDAVKTGTETASANSGALSNLLNKLRPSSTAPMSKLIPIKCIQNIQTQIDGLSDEAKSAGIEYELLHLMRKLKTITDDEYNRLKIADYMQS